MGRGVQGGRGGRGGLPRNAAAKRGGLNGASGPSTSNGLSNGWQNNSQCLHHDNLCFLRTFSRDSTDQLL